MNKFILVLSLLTFCILLYLVFILSQQNSLIPFRGKSLENAYSSQFLSESKKVIWFKIVTPAKSDYVKGDLYFKTEDGVLDSIRIPLSRASALLNLLKEKEVLYNPRNESFIFIKDYSLQDSVNLQ